MIFLTVMMISGRLISLYIVNFNLHKSIPTKDIVIREMEIFINHLILDYFITI